MLVREAMTSPAVTLRAVDDALVAARVLLQQRIASAPVVDAAGKLVGIASEADLLRGRSGPDPRAHLRPVEPGPVGSPGRSVGDVMSTPVVSVRGDEDVARAAELLLGHGLKMLPVVAGGRVVGVLARRDLLVSSARSDDDVRRDVVRLLDDLGLADRVVVDVGDGVVTLAGESTNRTAAAAMAVRTVPGVARVTSTSPAASASPPPSAGPPGSAGP